MTADEIWALINLVTSAPAALFMLILVIRLVYRAQYSGRYASQVVPHLLTTIGIGAYAYYYIGFNLGIWGIERAPSLLRPANLFWQLGILLLARHVFIVEASERDKKEKIEALEGKERAYNALRNSLTEYGLERFQTDGDSEEVT